MPATRLTSSPGSRTSSSSRSEQARSSPRLDRGSDRSGVLSSAWPGDTCGYCAGRVSVTAALPRVLTVLHHPPEGYAMRPVLRPRRAAHPVREDRGPATRRNVSTRGTAAAPRHDKPRTSRTVLLLVVCAYGALCLLVMASCQCGSRPPGLSTHEVSVFSCPLQTGMTHNPDNTAGPRSESVEKRLAATTAPTVQKSATATSYSRSRNART